MNANELEELLTKAVDIIDKARDKDKELDLDVDLWVCRGTTMSPHTPMIGHGWQCPFCDKIESYDDEIGTKDKEIEEAQGLLNEMTEKYDNLIDENNQNEKDIDALSRSLEEKEAKLSEAFDRYPEFAI